MDREVELEIPSDLPLDVAPEPELEPCELEAADDMPF